MYEIISEYTSIPKFWYSDLNIILGIKIYSYLLKKCKFTIDNPITGHGSRIHSTNTKNLPLSVTRDGDTNVRSSKVVTGQGI